MSDLIVIGVAAAQISKPAKGKYPETVDITFVTEDGDTLKVNSPVAIDPANLLIRTRFTLVGYRARMIEWNDRHFLTHDCKTVTGQVLK